MLESSIWRVLTVEDGAGLPREYGCMCAVAERSASPSSRLDQWGLGMEEKAVDLVTRL